MTAIATGAKAEKRAKKWLTRKGLKFRQANFRTRGGEIDLIMEDGEVLVFVEVRYRSNSDQFGGAAGSIDHRKIKKIITTSLAYLQQQKLDVPCRFDVVTVDADDNIDWLQNAFEGA